MSNQDNADNNESGDETSSNSSSGDEVVAAEPLATTRSRRANAGNRMDRIIQDEDEFYANLYGGFNEEDDDMDFDSEDDADDEEVEDDYDVDSDFSIDETDEIKPEHQAEDEEPRKRRIGYRDPNPKGLNSSAGPSSSTPAQPRAKPSLSSTPQTAGRSRAERSFRDSTRKKTEETIKNIQTEGKRKKKKSRNSEAWRPLTQDEMLAEAKITEEENIKSLENYQRTESEKLKKLKQVKKTLPLPYVTYTSLRMPVLNKEGEYYSRNFLSFHPDFPKFLS